MDPAAYRTLTGSVAAEGRSPSTAWRWAPLVVAVVVHLVMAYNAVYHHPFIGYDAGGHLENLEVYSQLRLPGPADSCEFFSPPLPYLPPALDKHIGLVGTRGMRKLAQLLNLLYSVLTFILLARICQRRWPGDPVTMAWAFAFLGFLPVWVKSVAFIRGEPLLALVTVAAADQTLLLVQGRGSPLRRGLLLGLCFAAMALSRQWGLFAVAAVAGAMTLDAARRRPARARLTAAAVLSLVLLVAGSGWFYLHLRRAEGAVTAFNRAPAPSFSLANQPRSFYLGLGLPQLFTEPLRTSFTNQLLPAFYSELWGDYECYFLVYGKERDTGRYVAGHALERALSDPSYRARLETNRYTLNRYLGCAQLLALLPTGVLLCGLGLGVRRSWSWLRARWDPSALPLEALAVAIVVASFAGYFWFLVMYPKPDKGDTIKATYMLQTMPFLALLAARWMRWLRRRWRRAAVWLSLSLVLVYLHNLGLLFTRYTRFM